jgi:hypothetical protein
VAVDDGVIETTVGIEGWVGLPATTSELPATTSELPATTSELPATTSELPDTTPELPSWVSADSVLGVEAEPATEPPSSSISAITSVIT